MSDGNSSPINYHAHIDMKTAQGTVVPWVASQTDLLAEDWHMVAADDESHVPYVEGESA